MTYRVRGRWRALDLIHELGIEFNVEIAHAGLLSPSATTASTTSGRHCEILILYLR